MLVHSPSSYLSFFSKPFHNQNNSTTREVGQKWYPPKTMHPTTCWSPSATKRHASTAWSPRRPLTDSKMSLAGSSHCKNTPLWARSKVWTPCQRHPQAKVQAGHWKRNVDPHCACRPRLVLHASTCHWKCSCTTRAVCGRAQDTDEELQWLPWQALASKKLTRT